MPRPCHCEKIKSGADGQVYTLDQCRLCWLYHHDPTYRRHWLGEDDNSRRIALPCANLGPLTGEAQECASCRGRVQIKLRACIKHGSCSPVKRLSGAPCCLDCADYESPPPTVRHLIAHFWPIRGNGVWQRHVEQLKRRWALFNGRKYVAVVHDESTDTPRAVAEAFGKDSGVRVIFERNNPELREVQTFYRLWSKVISAAPEDAVFYCQSKGVRGQRVSGWVSTMYRSCLDYWPLVSELLRTHILAGSFKRHGVGFSNTEGKWHYGGTFFWARCARVHALDWRRIDQAWFGMESWPGVLVPTQDAAVIFDEGPVQPTNRLYEPEVFNTEIAPAFRAWEAEHAHQRLETW